MEGMIGIITHHLVMRGTCALSDTMFASGMQPATRLCEVYCCKCPFYDATLAHGLHIKGYLIYYAV